MKYWGFGMATLVFILIATVGLFTTRTLLKITLRHESYTRQIGALTVSSGLGGTWFLSFIAPIAVASDFKVEFGLFVFILVTSIGVGIIAYFVALFLLPRTEE